MPDTKPLKSNSHHLIFYSKPGCHLCEGLYEKLQAIDAIALNVEVRDITTNTNWFELYQYEIPVLAIVKKGVEVNLPRFSPRTTTKKIEEKLMGYLSSSP